MSFPICQWLLVGRAREGLHVEHTVLGRPWPKEMLPSQAYLLYIRCQVPTQWEATSVSRPISRTWGVFSKSDKNCPINWQPENRQFKLSYRLPTQEPAEALLPGWLLANSPPCPCLTGKVSCWEGTPGQGWQPRSPQWVSRLEASHRDTPPCRAVGAASWLEASLCFQT